MRILCYGDSNTYGYDPRSTLSDRYPEEQLWTSLLKADNRQVDNWGMNGREIPGRPAEIDAAMRVFAAANADTLIIMLGSNDLLMHPAATAESVCKKMETFLRAIQEALPNLSILLLSPVPMVPGVWVMENRLVRESERLAGLYSDLAKQLKIAFADAGKWNVELAFDGVHFSQNGHARFAAGLLEYLDG